MLERVKCFHVIKNFIVEHLQTETLFGTEMLQ